MSGKFARRAQLLEVRGTATRAVVRMTFAGYRPDDEQGPQPTYVFAYGQRGPMRRYQSTTTGTP